MALTNPLVSAAIYVIMLIVFYFGAKIIVTSGGTELQVGGLSSILTYGMQILMSLLMVSMTMVMISMSFASAGRIVEVLEEGSTIKNPTNAVCKVEDGSIDFENVDFAYSKKQEVNTLRNISFHINSGETIGIIGGTGSSKSTLIQLIPRLYDVTKGSVKVGGIDVRKYDIRTLRDAVSVVLQKNVLFSGTIKENLRWGDKNATDEDIIRVCKLAQADEFIEQMPDKYDTYIEQGGTNVSGGQKQRLCIARAILKDAPIYVFDDSFSALDFLTEANLRRSLNEKIQGKTQIVITQRITSAMNADHIFVMDRGRLVDHGVHAELLSRCRIYQEIYASQTGGDAK